MLKFSRSRNKRRSFNSSCPFTSHTCTEHFKSF